MKQVNGSHSRFQPHHLTPEELIREAFNSEDPMVRRLAQWLDDIFEPLQDAMYSIGYDDDPRMIVKDYQNADMDLGIFLQTEWWHDWDCENRDLIRMDSRFRGDRAERLEDAAVDGSDGSTHGERIADMREALQSREAADEFGQLTVKRLLVEVEALYKWFELKGELDTVGG